MLIQGGGLNDVHGFRYAAIACGIRYPDRLDYCLIAADFPCTAAGMFTTNRVFAAPVRLCRERVGAPVSAILINATNANACTGDEGMETARILTADIAARLNCAPTAVLAASTGIIGRQLPREKMLAVHGDLVAALDPAAGPLLSRAIMTTDTRPKETAASFDTSRGRFTVAGTAKGAGMIAPNMATLLCFLVTDAPVAKPDLDRLFGECVADSLNAITIDGDMSTNDTALILSPADAPPLAGDDLKAFRTALGEVLWSLAEQLVGDGEGTTKVVAVEVSGARSGDDARRIARAVAQSLLVKTALYGNDPNWGRIACAAGYSGAEIIENRLSVTVGGIPLLDRGTPLDFDRGTLVASMKTNRFTIAIDAGLGSGAFCMLTTDLTEEYVKINAEYST